VVQEAFAVGRVGVQDGLAVGAGGEVVAPGRQGFPQLHVVVDLAVGDHHQVPVRAEQGLVAPAGIDDGQAGVAQGGGAFQEMARIVRPAVGQGVELGRERGLGCLPVLLHVAGDAAHGFRALLGKGKWCAENTKPAAGVKRRRPAISRGPDQLC